MYVREGGGDNDETRFFEDPVEMEESIDITEPKVDTREKVIEVNRYEEEKDDEENDSEKDETAIVPNAIDESDTLTETQVNYYIYW